jgi:hypothetical protein
MEILVNLWFITVVVAQHNFRGVTKKKADEQKNPEKAVLSACPFLFIQLILFIFMRIHLVTFRTNI